MQDTRKSGQAHFFHKVARFAIEDIIFRAFGFWLFVYVGYRI